MNEQEIIEHSVFGAVHIDDPRDISLASFTPSVQTPDVYKTDVTSIPVWNQRQIGSCVAHAMMKVLQILHFQQTGELLDLSPRFPYAITKNMDGLDTQGTEPRTVFKNYSTKGCATQTTLPNDTTLSYSDYINLSNISTQAYPEALEILKKMGGTYAFADITEQGITQAIYQFKAVACLMRVGNTYWVAPDGTVTWDKNKILPIQRPKEITGGHEIVLTGYEKVNGRTKIFFLNSWSDQWADNGSGWFWLDEHINLINQIMCITEVPQNLIQVATSKQFTINLSYGMTNNAEVKRMQQFLIDHGYSIPSGTTGNYFNETKNAVAKFQKDNGILTIFQGKFWYEKTRAMANSKI